VAKLMITLAGLLVSTHVWAAGLDPAPFFKHFEAIKSNTGQTTQLVLRKGNQQFTIQPIIEEIRRDLEMAQALKLADGSRFISVMNEMHGSQDWEREWSPEHQQLALRSYQELMKIDIDAVFNNPKFKEVMQKFEGKLKEHLMGHRTMAHLEDSKFFYTRAVTYKLTTVGLELAQKALGTVPLLSIASMIIERAVDSISERRIYHQNMLLFYFERFDSVALQLTEEEIGKAKSSVYESRIPWFLYPESKKAQANWRWYGSDYFGYYQMQCDKTLASNMKRYTNAEERHCFAFQTVTEKNHRKIVNLMDRKFIMAPMPSDAYFYADPKKVQRQRRLLRLTQLGLQFVPVNSMIKGVFNTFINSMYVSQQRTEGALHGYFESSGMPNQAAQIVQQTSNPYLKSDFGLSQESQGVWTNWN
jgi:hypothetical protein